VEGGCDHAAIGTVSNVASRLCDEAKPGQILISPRVLVAVEDAVQVEPVGEFELKGIRGPLAAYNVIGAASAGALGTRSRSKETQCLAVTLGTPLTRFAPSWLSH
jgi:class 3 adenylate cyclase